MKILVTGATSHVGSEVFRSLAGQDAPVIAGVRDIEKAKLHLAPGVADESFRPFDFNAPATWPPALADVEKMYFVVPPGTTDPSQVEFFLKTAISTGVSHIVFNSGRTTCDMPGEPLNIVEGLLKKSGIDWTILRPGWFMQNFLHWVGFTIPKEDAFYLPASDAKTAFVDVRDVGAVAAKVLTERGHNGRMYELTSTQALTHFEVAQKISLAAGRTIRYVHLNDAEFVKAMMERGWSQASADHTVFLYRIVRTGKEAAVSQDMEKILGRQGVDFEKFAIDYAASWLSV